MNKECIENINRKQVQFVFRVTDTFIETDLKPVEVIKEKTFYVFWLIYFFNTIAIGYINAMGKSFGQTFIKDDHFLAVMVSLAAIFNASGRVVWGRLMDLTSFKVSSFLFFLRMSKGCTLVTC